MVSSAELGNLRSLVTLHLGNNPLRGSIPPELGNLENLRVLKIDTTFLNGPIPRDFTDIPLYSFHWRATDLCAPDDVEFREWLASIDDHVGGGTCPDS